VDGGLEGLLGKTLNFTVLEADKVGPGFDRKEGGGGGDHCWWKVAICCCGHCV